MDDTIKRQPEAAREVLAALRPVFDDAVDALAHACASEGRLVNRLLDAQQVASFEMAWAGAELLASDIEFGACDYVHAFAKDGGAVALSIYSVSGGGGAHLRAESFGRIALDDTATLLTNVTFADGWVVCDGGLGLVKYDGGSIDLGGHTVTGKRYDIQAGSICNTYGGGASFLPGSVAGTTASGGQYL